MAVLECKDRNLVDGFVQNAVIKLPSTSYYIASYKKLLMAVKQLVLLACKANVSLGSYSAELSAVSLGVVSGKSKHSRARLTMS